MHHIRHIYEHIGIVFKATTSEEKQERQNASMSNTIIIKVNPLNTCAIVSILAKYDLNDFEMTSRDCELNIHITQQKYQKDAMLGLNSIVEWIKNDFCNCQHHSVSWLSIINTYYENINHKKLMV